MAKEEVELVDFEEFFDGAFGKGVVEIHDYEEKRGFFGAVGALAAMVVLSVIAGALVTVPGLVYASAAAQLAVPAAEFWKSLPEDLPEVAIGERNRLLDKNGNVFAELWTEDRITLDSIDDISPYAIEALIDTEDKRFYEHGGFDPIGTVRAALTSGGGSGITQQLVKNLQFYDMAGRDKQDEAVEESYNRKIRELKYAMSYEKSHSKNEILLAYFNTVAFGKPTIYSIEAAANYFFDKSAKDLDLAESAALVGSVKNPSVYNLDSTDEETIKNWKDRQATVLARMVDEGSISQEEADEASAQELTIVRKAESAGNCSSSKYPFYCDYVVDYLLNSPKFGETEEERAAILAKGGLTINTYLDPAALEAMENQLRNDLGTENRLIAPSAIVEPGTGGVVAIASNRLYGEGPGKTTLVLPNVDAATGSTYKMIDLAAALEVLPEGELTFGSGCPYVPPAGFDAPPGGFNNSNGCGYQSGVLNYKQATAWSSNTWFLTLAVKVGMDNILAMSEKMNLRTDGLNESSLAMAIGSKENSPIRMAAAYATFANEGVFCPATPVASYTYDDGSSPVMPETYDPAEDSCRSVMSPYTASRVLQAMRANTYPGEVNGAFGTKGYIPGYDAVGKSGTNEHLNSVWAQVSKNYSIFTNIYDMDSPNNGFAGYIRGVYNMQSPATTIGSDLLRNVISATNPQRSSLNFDSNDRDYVEVPVDRREFFTVPSFAGLQPEQALAVADSLGITVHVDKETVATPEHYSPGVVVEQSIEAGTQLPKGSKKELILKLGE